MLYNYALYIYYIYIYIYIYIIAAHRVFENKPLMKAPERCLYVSNTPLDGAMVSFKSCKVASTSHFSAFELNN